jgi:mRNA interferase MazF
MTGYSFGDVVLVPFPFTDQTETKKRPAAVVSSAAYHRERNDLILLAVTSQVRSELGIGEAPVTGWREAGLIKPSILKPILFTLTRSLIVKRLGRLSGTDRKALQECLSTILEIGL